MKTTLAEIQTLSSGEDYESLKATGIFKQKTLLHKDCYIRANGNYYILYFPEDMIKVRFSIDDERIQPEYPECIEILISPEKINKVIDYKIYNPEKYNRLKNDFKLLIYTEVTLYIDEDISGSLDGFKYFLEQLSDNHLFVNLVMSQEVFRCNRKKVKCFQQKGLINGVGLLASNLDDPENDYMIKDLIYENNYFNKKFAIYTVPQNLTIEQYQKITSNHIQLNFIGGIFPQDLSEYFYPDIKIEEEKKHLKLLSERIKNDYPNINQKLSFDLMAVNQLELNKNAKLMNSVLNRELTTVMVNYKTNKLSRSISSIYDSQIYLLEKLYPQMMMLD